MSDIQSSIRTIQQVLAAATAVSGGDHEAAILWYRNEPSALFDYKTTVSLVADPHGDLDPVIAAVERFQPEAIVLLGDIQAHRPLHVELKPILDLTGLWFIHGNHDTDSDADYDNLWGSELATHNLHGRTVEIAGYKVAGLGGIFRSKIWDPPRPIEGAAFQSSDTMRRSMKSDGVTASGVGIDPVSSRPTISNCCAAAPPASW